MLVSPASAEKKHNGLQPGETVTFEQNVPVNIVFIGYKKNAINMRRCAISCPKRTNRLLNLPTRMVFRAGIWG
jgi:hypothetical protein